MYLRLLALGNGRAKLFPSMTRRTGWFLAWVIALTYLPFLNQLGVPLTGDQKVYLSTALEMRETGSWLQPLLFGQGSYFKPPFQYWATLVGWKVFGLSLLGALLPSVLALFTTAFLIEKILDLLKLGESRPRVGLAGLLFATCLGTWTFGTTAQMEIWLVFFQALAFYLGLRGIRKPAWLYLAFAVAGLGAWVKSPLYSVFWVVGFSSFLVMKKETRIFRSPHLYLACLSGVFLGLGWFVWILWADGDRFWAHYILQETVSKKGTPMASVPVFWLSLFEFCVPFTPLLIPGALTLLRHRELIPLRRFLLAWTWPAALFFSIFPYRISPYLHFLVPVAAILAALVSDRRWIRGTVVAFGTLAFGAGLILGRTGLVPAAYAAGLAGVGVAGAVLGWRMAADAGGFALGVPAMAVLLALRAASAQLGESDVRGLREAVSERPDAPLALIDSAKNIWHDVGLLSAVVGRPIRRLTEVSEGSTFLATGGSLILDEEQTRNLISAGKLGDASLESLVVTPWSRLRSRVNFPYREVLLQGRDSVPDLDSKTHRAYSVVRLKN